MALYCSPNENELCYLFLLSVKLESIVMVCFFFWQYNAKGEDLPQIKLISPIIVGLVTWAGNDQSGDIGSVFPEKVGINFSCRTLISTGHLNKAKNRISELIRVVSRLLCGIN